MSEVKGTEIMEKSSDPVGVDYHVTHEEAPEAGVLGTEEREFTPLETKRLLRKLDWALLPLLSLLYLLSFLDRANIGNAKLAGLEKDLGMTGKYDYNVRFPQTTSFALQLTL